MWTLLLLAVSLPVAKPDLGGLTFDFAEASRLRFGSALDVKRNLHSEAFSGSTDGKETRYVHFPKGSFRNYRVSGYYRLHQDVADRSVILVNSGTFDEQDKFVPRAEYELLLADRADDWVPFSVRITSKRGITDGARIEFVVKGKGRLDFKDVVLTSDYNPAAIEFRLIPHGNIDSSFAVSEGQCGYMNWYWRKNMDRKYDLGELVFSLRLPPGIRFVAAAQADGKTVKTECAVDGCSITTFRLRRPYPPFDWQFNTHDAIRILVESVCGPGECGTGLLSVSHEKAVFPTASSDPVRFLVVPKIGTAVPVRYMNGIMTDWCFGYEDQAMSERLSKLFADCGVRWIVNKHKESKPLYPFWRKLGIRRITPEVDGTCGKKLMGAEHTRDIFEDADYFRDKLAPELRDTVEGADGLWANWEVSGSYKVLDGRDGKEKSENLAKAVQAIDRVVTVETGGKGSCGFIPGVCWIEMGSWWRPRNYLFGMQAIYYADKLKWINPWGPYVAWESDYPWIAQKRKPLAWFLAARDVRETVDRDYPKSSRPRLMSLPQGYQCGNWLTEPEWLGMALDSAFFNRFESTVAYYFPCGYDARYWRAYADATGRAAKYEQYVLDGVACDGRIHIQADKDYAAPVKHVSGYLPGQNGISLLQSRAFEGKKGRMIVAVFNFWDRGEAYFRLKVDGLKGDFEVVSESGMLRASSFSRRRYSGGELCTKGVELVVGAARCVVFELRPSGDRSGTPADSILTDDELRRIHDSRRQKLSFEAGLDSKCEAANDALYPDWMPVL